MAVKRVLITGCTGFIGKHLAKRLRDRGNTGIRCLVWEECSKENIICLEQRGIQLGCGNLCDDYSPKGLANTRIFCFYVKSQTYDRSKLQLLIHPQFTSLREAMEQTREWTLGEGTQ